MQACPVTDLNRRKRLVQTRRNCWNALKRKATKAYLDTWQQKRTERYIAIWGKEQADDRDRTDLVSALCTLIPERRRWAEKMMSRESLPERFFGSLPKRASARRRNVSR